LAGAAITTIAQMNTTMKIQSNKSAPLFTADPLAKHSNQQPGNASEHQEPLDKSSIPDLESAQGGSFPVLGNYRSVPECCLGEDAEQHQGRVEPDSDKDNGESKPE
jgi:hypothetical protein